MVGDERMSNCCFLAIDIYGFEFQGVMLDFPTAFVHSLRSTTPILLLIITLALSATIPPPESAFLFATLFLLYACVRDRARARPRSHQTLLLLYVLLLPFTLPPVIIWVQDLVHRGPKILVSIPSGPIS